MTHLLKVITQFDDWSTQEHSIRVHDESTVFERVQITRDEQQIRARLDGQETRSGNVDPVSTPEMLDGRTNLNE